MGGGAIRAALVGGSALVLAVGCGGSDEPAGSADTGGDARPTTPLPKPGAPESGLTPEESRWVADSRIVALLGNMRRDIRVVLRGGVLQDGLIFMTADGPTYGCKQSLGRAGRAPTARLVRIRRLTREACDHLDAALAEMLTFKATSPSGATNPQRAKRAAIEREVRLAGPPAARAQTLLAEARTS